VTRGNTDALAARRTRRQCAPPDYYTPGPGRAWANRTWSRHVRRALRRLDLCDLD
jgi:hypothetical protein